MSGAGDIARAAEILRRGGVVAFPTETVYGLGADATNAAAIAKVFALKGRPPDHPLIVHVANAAALDAWAQNVPATARKLAATFWPGPLTMILPRSPRVPDAVTGGQDSVGLRCPAHPVARFRDVPHTEAGMRHVTLAYDDVRGMIETLEAAGVEIVEHPRRAYNTEMISRVAFVRDPDGILVELIERAPGR